jgi:hypothetical protein
MTSHRAAAHATDEISHATEMENRHRGQQKKPRKEEVHTGRRIERLLGYCRWCELELERNTTNPRKCDGGGSGSILGNVVILAGVMVMMASAIVSKSMQYDLLEESDLCRKMKLWLRDGGMVLLAVGYISEKAARSRQRSCCCRCAKKHDDISRYMR